MAKAVAVTGDDRSSTPQGKMTTQVTSSFRRMVDFLSDVRGEMRKVSTPSRKEVQATTTVVVVTVFAFAAYFAVIDYVIGNGVQWLLHRLGGQ